MATGPNMLAYTIKATMAGDYAKVVVGQGSGKKSFDANSQNANIYWWYSCPIRTRTTWSTASRCLDRATLRFPPESTRT
jgi:hypothetical protein